MKSQDILILLKLASFQKQGLHIGEGIAERYSARGLSDALGVSKTEVNASINRSIDVGLAVRDRKTKAIKVNKKALFEFIVHGLKYVFPVKVSRVERGVSTAFAAPVLEQVLLSGGDLIYVWPYAQGSEKGEAILPLFKTVPFAIQQDPLLYEYLALVDAIRVGNARETKVASALLKERLLSND